MEFTLTLIILVVLAGFIKGFVGFGLSLILVTVLFESGFHPSEFLPIIVPIFVTLDILLFLENRKYINIKSKENFAFHSGTVLTLFIGTVLGSYFLMRVENLDMLKAGFAILVLVMLYFLIKRTHDNEIDIPDSKQNSVFGLGTGIMTGLFTINSVMSSMYLLYHKYPKEKYMGTLVTFLLISDLILIGIYMTIGLFTWEGLRISILFLLMTAGGFFAGIIMRNYISVHYFKKIVIGVLMINSFKILVETVVFI